MAVSDAGGGLSYTLRFFLAAVIVVVFSVVVGVGTVYLTAERSDDGMAADLFSITPPEPQLSPPNLPLQPPVEPPRSGEPGEPAPPPTPPPTPAFDDLDDLDAPIPQSW